MSQNDPNNPWANDPWKAPEPSEEEASKEVWGMPQKNDFRPNSPQSPTPQSSNNDWKPEPDKHLLYRSPKNAQFGSENATSYGSQTSIVNSQQTKQSFRTDPNSGGYNPYGAPSSAKQNEQWREALANRGSRLIAQIIDMIFFFFIVIFFTIFFIIANTVITSKPYSEIGMMASFLPWFAIQFYLLSVNGQTVGKKIMKIKIVRFDDQRAGVWRIFLLRMFLPGLLTMFPFFGLFFGTANVLYIFSDDRRCIHDLFADTKVIRV